MLDIAATENQIQTFIEPQTLTNLYPNVSAYRLRLYPGELDDLGKPISANHVVVQFKRTDLEEIPMNQFRSPCRQTQINKVVFNILVQSNNLRSHREVYGIASAIVRQLRGKRILVMANGDEVHGQTPCQVLSYNFDKVDNGGVCYQSSLEIMSKYTDIFEI